MCDSPDPHSRAGSARAATSSQVAKLLLYITPPDLNIWYRIVCESYGTCHLLAIQFGRAERINHFQVLAFFIKCAGIDLELTLAYHIQMLVPYHRAQVST